MRGNKYIMVVQDYSKWVELFAIPNKTTVTIAEKLSHEVLTRYGVCDRLHSDQGREFESEVVSMLCESWGINKTRSTPYAPWSCGQVERTNRTIKQMLRQMCDGQHEDWNLHLPYMRMTLNHTVHSSVGVTPFSLFMTRSAPARMPCDLLYGTPQSTTEDGVCLPRYIFQQNITCQRSAEMARKHLRAKILSRKADWDRAGLKIRSFQVGQLVWRFWKPNEADKLSGQPWTGPYKVLEVDPEEYTVKLAVPKAGGGTIAKWIHVSNIKPVGHTKDGKVLCTEVHAIGQVECETGMQGK